MPVSKIRDVASGIGEALAGKAAHLIEVLRPLCPAVVAFSGGVDSSLLLAVAHEACGGGVLAVTASSATYPRSELANAREIAALIGAEHRVLKTRELEDPAFSGNPLDRCYHCKRELFLKIKQLAAAEGYRAAIEGSTVEDLHDFRPGERALRELGVMSPLRQASFTKSDVRQLARLIGLPNWDKPAAACLASRIPYGIGITREALARIERMEDMLHELGFSQVRARFHGDLVRIEVEPAKIELASGPEMRDKIVQAGRREGFRFVTLDLQGYRMGSFNP
jgi:uncharacterized protein